VLFVPAQTLSSCSSKFDENVTYVLARVQILEGVQRILKCKGILVHELLQADFLLRQEVTQILLILRRPDEFSLTRISTGSWLR
jgi:hypothetical protein